MLYIFKLKRFWFVLLIPVSYAAVALAGANPGLTERFYSAGFYKALSGAVARATGIAPFSIAEWVLIAGTSMIMAYIAVSIIKTVKSGGRRGAEIAKLLATFVMIFSLVVFGFTSVCGVNYHRQTFAEQNGFDVRPSSIQELAAVCGELCENVNMLSKKVNRNEYGAMLHSYKSDYALALETPGLFASLGQKYGMLSGFCPRAKPVLFSRALSICDLVGVYFPFTFEANVNADVPDYLLPSSMLHELAHYKGFMREDEANFIAYLACRESDIADFSYSGHMLAFTHATNALHGADTDAYRLVMESLDPGAVKDLNANHLYWKQFEGPVAEFSEAVNDVYLKTNRQAEGVRSYGRMVDLLLADYRKRNG